MQNRQSGNPSELRTLLILEKQFTTSRFSCLSPSSRNWTLHRTISTQARYCAKRNRVLRCAYARCSADPRIRYTARNSCATMLKILLWRSNADHNTGSRMRFIKSWRSSFLRRTACCRSISACSSTCALAARALSSAASTALLRERSAAPRVLRSPTPQPQRSAKPSVQCSWLEFGCTLPVCVAQHGSIRSRCCTLQLYGVEKGHCPDRGVASDLGRGGEI